MSILKHYNWEHSIRFEDGSITHLFIENPITFRKYVLELLQQINGEDGDFVLSDPNEIPISKNLIMLTDPINLQFDEKKINSKINKDLLTIATGTPEIERESFSLIAGLERYALRIAEEYGYNIEYDVPEASSLLKMLSFHISTEYESQADKLLEWMNITHDILKIENFVLLNLQTYFSESELKLLYAEASSSKHNLLLINQFNYYSLPDSIIIDQDNCELFKSPII